MERVLGLVDEFARAWAQCRVDDTDGLGECRRGCEEKRDALIDALEEARAELDMLALWKREIEAEFPHREDECPLPVFVARMIKRGASYDGETGVWYTSDDKPGIVRKLEQERDALREALEPFVAVIDAIEDFEEKYGDGGPIEDSDMVTDSDGLEIRHLRAARRVLHPEHREAGE